MIRQIYTPQYPKLMAAEGPKCGFFRDRGDRVPMACVKAKGHEGNHLQDVDPRYLRPDWNSPVVEEATVLFFDENSNVKALRGFVGEPTDEILVVTAQALGAVAWRTLGTLSGYASTKVTEVDYAPDGSKLMTRTRLIGEPGTFGPLCDCGKGAYCPEFGTAFRRVERSLTLSHLEAAEA